MLSFKPNQHDNKYRKSSISDRFRNGYRPRLRRSLCKGPGYITILADIKEPRSQIESLVAQGYKAVFYGCDVSNTRTVKEMIEWIAATYGHLDAALNNAGIPNRPNVRWRKSPTTNLTAR